MYIEFDLRRQDAGSMLQQIQGSEFDAIAISSRFSLVDLISPEAGECRLPDEAEDLLKASSEALRTGGLLFVYGAPRLLPAYAEVLGRLGEGRWKLEFKYWIGIQLHQDADGETLHAVHVGLLLFHKTSVKGITPFGLNRGIRVPHMTCSACGKNVRDWGGKKHLMNPSGSALSDVWTDLPVRALADHRMPDDVLDRVLLLANGRVLHIVDGDRWVGSNPTSRISHPASLDPPTPRSPKSSFPLLDRVEFMDCISFMDGLLPRHAHNAFDLVFADPPYNLAKLYTNYTDEQAEAEYVAWCDRWLELCALLLKPGGSMFVLNLPKWALRHAHTLDGILQFRRWIVWQALAEPRGKLLPAHYALLYYTKPGAPPVFNYDGTIGAGRVEPPESPEYCLRQSCVKKRKAEGDDRRVPLTDIWFDIHRIRHKRDRDYHPCQLPEKLLERVVALASHPGQVVFDPFCGVGTTAVAAKRLGRHFVTTDVDSSYIEITRRKLEQVDAEGKRPQRPPVPRQARPVTKKHIESAVQQLARELGRVPDLEDVHRADPSIYEGIRQLYPNPQKALRGARLVLSDQ